MGTSQWISALIKAAATMKVVIKGSAPYKQAEAEYVVAFNALLSRGYKSTYLLEMSGVPIPPALSKKG